MCLLLKTLLSLKLEENKTVLGFSQTQVKKGQSKLREKFPENSLEEAAFRDLQKNLTKKVLQLNLLKRKLLQGKGQVFIHLEKNNQEKGFLEKVLKIVFRNLIFKDKNR